MVNTARAALQIFTRQNPSFERTAKFGIGESAVPERSWKLKRYQLAPDRIVIAELALAFYAVFAAALAFNKGNWGVFTYALIFGMGLFAVSGATIANTVGLRRLKTQRQQALRSEAELLRHGQPVLQS